MTTIQYPCPCEVNCGWKHWRKIDQEVVIKAENLTSDIFLKLAEKIVRGEA